MRGPGRPRFLLGRFNADMMPRDVLSADITARPTEAVCGVDWDNCGDPPVLLRRPDRHSPRAGPPDADRKSDGRGFANASSLHSAAHSRSDPDTQPNLHRHEYPIRAGKLDSDIHCDSDPDSNAIHYPQPHTDRLAQPDRRAYQHADRHTDGGTEPRRGVVHFSLRTGSCSL